MFRSARFSAGCVVLCLIAGFQSSAHAQGWLERASGGRLSTPKPIRDIAPNGVSIGGGRQDQGSSLMVIVGPYIKADGGVMYGSNTGNVREIARASLTRNSRGQAFWVYKGAENSPLRAPRYDRPVDRTVRYEVNANNGVVYRVEYMNGQRQLGSQEVQRLKVQYDNQGRPYYAYNGKTYWANNQPWRKPQQPQYPQNPQYPSGGGQQAQDPGVAIAVGILQAIDQAARNNNRRP
jgi:hypothetical protein